LSGWSLGNRNSQANLPGVKIPAGDYVVFSSDSAYYNYFKPTSANIVILKKWPGLNYTSDLIWLHDLTGKTIDSLRMNGAIKSRLFSGKNPARTGEFCGGIMVIGRQF
jgi:hypothetical protein